MSSMRLGSCEKDVCIPHGSLEEQNLYNEYILTGVYQIGLHKRVWVVQQQLTHTSDTGNPVVHQSMWSVVSTVSIWHRRPGGLLKHLWFSIQIGSPNPDPNINEGMQQWPPWNKWTCQPERRQAGKRHNMPFFHLLLLGCPGTVPPTFGAEPPTSDNVIKRTCHRRAQLVTFYLIPDPVKLATKINHHMMSTNNWKGKYLIENKEVELD